MRVANNYKCEKIQIRCQRIAEAIRGEGWTGSLLVALTQEGIRKDRGDEGQGRRADGGRARAL